MVLNLILIALIWGGNVRPFALHQVRDQILPGPGLISGSNTFRENIRDNVRSEVNNQNLHGYNPIQNNMNTVNSVVINQCLLVIRY